LYPDVDYPREEESTIHLPDQPAIFREEPESLGQTQEEAISTNRDSDSQSLDQKNPEEILTAASLETSRHLQRLGVAPNI